MRAIAFLALLLLSAICVNSKKSAVFIKSSTSDSLIKVNVQLEDLPGGGSSCGVIMFKANYKFKLICISRYNVQSKNDFIKIQFICPRETMAGMVIKNKYTFSIAPIYKADKAEQATEDGIPVYTYVR